MRGAVAARGAGAGPSHEGAARLGREGEPEPKVGGGGHGERGKRSLGSVEASLKSVRHRRGRTLLQSWIHFRCLM